MHADCSGNLTHFPPAVTGWSEQVSVPLLLIYLREPRVGSSLRVYPLLTLLIGPADRALGQLAMHPNIKRRAPPETLCASPRVILIGQPEMVIDNHSQAA